MGSRATSLCAVPPADQVAGRPPPGADRRRPTTRRGPPASRRRRRRSAAPAPGRSIHSGAVARASSTTTPKSPQAAIWPEALTLTSSTAPARRVTEWIAGALPPAPAARRKTTPFPPPCTFTAGGAPGAARSPASPASRITTPPSTVVPSGATSTAVAWVPCAPRYEAVATWRLVDVRSGAGARRLGPRRRHRARAPTPGYRNPVRARPKEQARAPRRRARARRRRRDGGREGVPQERGKGPRSLRSETGVSVPW